LNLLHTEQPNLDQTMTTTSQELRQAVANLASGEDGKRDAEVYWHNVLPPDWHGPYPREWCGAFSLWALRKALGCPWHWEVGKGYLYRLRTTQTPDLGDICYMDRPYQHHAVLTAVGEAADGRKFTITQDGNSGPYPGMVEEHWRAREKWTAIYSIQPLVDIAMNLR
jgi:hypothetical protein